MVPTNLLGDENSLFRDNTAATSTTQQTESYNTDFVVLAEKIAHTGALHGMVGGVGTFPLNNLFAIRFVKQENAFTMIQLVSRGVKSNISYHYGGNKTGKKKVEKKVLEVKTESTSKDLF